MLRCAELDVDVEEKVGRPLLLRLPTQHTPEPLQLQADRQQGRALYAPRECTRTEASYCHAWTVVTDCSSSIAAEGEQQQQQQYEQSEASTFGAGAVVGSHE